MRTRFNLFLKNVLVKTIKAYFSLGEGDLCSKIYNIVVAK